MIIRNQSYNALIKSSLHKSLQSEGFSKAMIKIEIILSVSS